MLNVFAARTFIVLTANTLKSNSGGENLLLNQHSKCNAIKLKIHSSTLLFLQNFSRLDYVSSHTWCIEEPQNAEFTFSCVESNVEIFDRFLFDQFVIINHIRSVKRLELRHQRLEKPTASILYLDSNKIIRLDLKSYHNDNYISIDMKPV